MARYVVMFPAEDEAAWAAASEEDRQVTYDVDLEFGQRLAARGGAVTGGAGLGPSAQARTLRSDGSHGSDGPAVTDGPSRPGPRQLSGFFIVTCDDYDALVDAARVLTQVHHVVEIWPVNEF